MQAAVRNRKVALLLASAMLAVHACLLAWSAYRHSPTHLEVFHLAAGTSHIRLGRFDLYRVNPPLVRTVAAIPVVLAGAYAPWASYDADPHVRAETHVGIDMMQANGRRTVWLTTLARWACVPFCVLGGWICFLWARRLYGDVAGGISCLLWCFCPYVLGHGATFSPDAHAAALGVAASYAFWLWLKKPTFSRAMLGGLILGLAELAKFTLLVFYPLWPVVWLLDRLTGGEKRTPSAILRECGSLSLLLGVSLLVINLGYGFEGSFRPLGHYRFQTRMFTGAESLEDISDAGGNRFSSTPLRTLPVPLPANFVQGIDSQYLDLERGVWSYLRGVWRIGGWRFFCLYALAIKVPLAMWLLVFIAALAPRGTRWFTAAPRDELFLLGTILTLMTPLCAQAGIGIHSRYAIALLPVLFIWTSRLGVVLARRKGLLRVTSILLGWLVASSLYQYPHSLSFFNEVVGGPRNGYLHLAKSDSSWGQDLLFLKQWLDRHPEASPLHLAHCGPFDPRLVGLDFALPPVGPRNANPPAKLPCEHLGPVPGWYAIDVCFLLGGDPLSASDGKGGWDEPSKMPGYDLSYFLRFEPVAAAGYSIRIYHITPQDANRVRQELGLCETGFQEGPAGEDHAVAASVEEFRLTQLDRPRPALDRPGRGLEERGTGHGDLLSDRPLDLRPAVFPAGSAPQDSQGAGAL